jgi:hypothetical protein
MAPHTHDRNSEPLHTEAKKTTTTTTTPARPDVAGQWRGKKEHMHKGAHAAVKTTAETK